MTDYIVLRAVSLLFFFLTFRAVHGGGTNSRSRSSTVIKNERQKVKKTTTGAIFCTNVSLHLTVPGHAKKKVISFVMCDSLFASMYTGNFIMAPPVILLLLLAPISKRHPGTV